LDYNQFDGIMKDFYRCFRVEMWREGCLCFSARRALCSRWNRTWFVHCAL